MTDEACATCGHPTGRGRVYCNDHEPAAPSPATEEPTRVERCNFCGGSGTYQMTSNDPTCPQCEGTGTVQPAPPATGEARVHAVDIHFDGGGPPTLSLIHPPDCPLPENEDSWVEGLSYDLLQGTFRLPVEVKWNAQHEDAEMRLVLLDPAPPPATGTRVEQTDCLALDEYFFGDAEGSREAEEAWGRISRTLDAAGVTSCAVGGWIVAATTTIHPCRAHIAQYMDEK